MTKLTIFVMLTLALGSLSVPLQSHAEASYKDKTQQLETIKTDIKQLEKTLKSIRKKRSSLEDALCVGY
jgi:septal ring factor EnvC (AmiA/AmiB activator)